MRVLIPTHPGDPHAMEVAMVLEERGHEAVQWYGSDFPTLQSASIELRDGQLQWEVKGPDLEGLHPSFDVVWVRRPTPPVLPKGLHPGDVPVAQRECAAMLGNLYPFVAPEAFWLNPPAAQARAEHKAVQLREAVRAGLRVPPTLMSNDPERIRRFLTEYRGRAVFKPFQITHWEGEGQVALMFTNDVTVEQLPRDELLRVTPGIFQARVPKAHELRVTIMGEHVAVARLRSQEVEGAQVDWRAAGGLIRIEPDRLPESVEAACLRLMRQLGILFGCMDFIVTPEGEHVFLEVNPAGQFLWVEESCPDIPLLAPFTEFVVARRADFRWQPGASIPRHRDYYPRARERIAAEQPRHIPATEVYVSSDREDGQRAPASSKAS